MAVNSKFVSLYKFLWAFLLFLSQVYCQNRERESNYDKLVAFDKQFMDIRSFYLTMALNESTTHFPLLPLSMPRQSASAFDIVSFMSSNIPNIELPLPLQTTAKEARKNKPTSQTHKSRKKNNMFSSTIIRAAHLANLGALTRDRDSLFKQGGTRDSLVYYRGALELAVKDTAILHALMKVQHYTPHLK